MPARRWFYELLTQEFGPVSSEQIDDLVSDGTLATSDRVRPEDSETWITVAQMPESTQDGSTAPAELSDLSELSFSFEENSESGTAADQLNIDTFSIEGDSDSAYAESDAAKRRRDKLTATDDEEDEEATELLAQILDKLDMSLEDLDKLEDPDISGDS